MNPAYLPAIIWIVLLVFVLSRHIKVYRLYDSQLKIVRKIEEAGGIEDGSTLVAVNQRIRYIVRIFLAVFGIFVGIAGTYGIYRPAFGRSILFGISVIGYFYLSEVATGYLTIRDERVIGRILDIDRSQRTDIQQNTDAMDRNTAAMTRNSDASEARDVREAASSDARDIRDAATLKANTDATEGNTDAITKNTEARDGYEH